MMNSHLTAISRKKLPVPVRWLLSQGMIHGHVLDYGCGKCKQLNDKYIGGTPGVSSITSYDPHWHPAPFSQPGQYPISYPQHSDWGTYDVILCTYVLCTVKEQEEKSILGRIQSLLRPNGVAYITVRNDEPRGGYGVSSKKTFQRKAEISFLYELRKVHQYRIYLLTPGNKLA
jgi:hypothetical protein